MRGEGKSGDIAGDESECSSPTRSTGDPGGEGLVDSSEVESNEGDGPIEIGGAVAVGGGLGGPMLDTTLHYI